MKTLIQLAMFLLLLGAADAPRAQDWPKEHLGLPGDNLNLYAVLNLFQSSETLEDFELGLNDPDSMINNLDLNNDNLVDYIMVFDYSEGDTHNIVLRIAVNDREYQDVAVIIVEKIRSGAVQIQLIGDEMLYGSNYIIEPAYAETPNPGYTGLAIQQTSSTANTTFYEVATWPIVVYISEPTYVPWHSPWYWGYYPPFWSPWTAFCWHFYHGYHYHWYAHYYAYYRPWRHYRCNYYRGYYYQNIRNYSTTVVVNVNNGRYKGTYQKPERVRDGQQLFAERHPNGVRRPESRRPQTLEERKPVTQQKPDQFRRENKPYTLQSIQRDNKPTGSSKPNTSLSQERRERNSLNETRRPKPTQSMSSQSKPEITQKPAAARAPAQAKPSNIRKPKQSSRPSQSINKESSKPKQISNTKPERTVSKPSSNRSKVSSQKVTSEPSIKKTTSSSTRNKR
jgi:hypothetical protein